MTPRTLYFNGIDATTGEYLLAPMDLDEFAQRVLPKKPIKPVSRRRALKGDLDPARLAHAGWGVILTPDTPVAVREALEPLLRHRRTQATAIDERRYRELVYRPGESQLRFLARHDVGPGPADPDKMPYYLMIAGGPESVPWQFQYQLGVQYAVGRVGFERPEDYATYAQSVVAYETDAEARPQRMAFFGVENPDDVPTRVSVDHLVRPLVERLASARPSWRAEILLRNAATKARLGRLLTEEPPALLFTASHAVAFKTPSERQLACQGALLCADWPGPRRWNRGIPDDHYFAAHDLAVGTRLPGLLSFHFACFTAGSPERDSFTEPGTDAVARRPFVARLAQRLLLSGALAVIGHVDLAWQQSFLWYEAGSQVAVFESTLLKLTAGSPVGLAMEDFALRYAEIATELADDGEEESPDIAHYHLWTAFKDARAYVVVGDPAVRLKVETPPVRTRAPQRLRLRS